MEQGDTSREHQGLGRATRMFGGYRAFVPTEWLLDAFYQGGERIVI